MCTLADSEDTRIRNRFDAAHVVATALCRGERPPAGSTCGKQSQDRSKLKSLPTFDHDDVGHVGIPPELSRGVLASKSLGPNTSSKEGPSCWKAKNQSPPSP